MAVGKGAQGLHWILIVDI